MKKPSNRKKNSKVKYYSNGNIRQEIISDSENFTIETGYKDKEETDTIDSENAYKEYDKFSTSLKTIIIKYRDLGSIHSISINNSTRIVNASLTENSHDGLSISDADGVIASHIKYSDHYLQYIKIGETSICWDWSGQIGFYDNSDWYFDWYKNGQLKIEKGQLIIEKNYQDFAYKAWHENGLQFFDEFVDYNGGVFKKTLWHKNGLAMQERNFFNGLKHGKCIEWLSNGQKFSEETYVNGVLIDSWNFTQEMNEEESLRYEFIRIREKIDALNGIYLSLFPAFHPYNLNTYYPLIDFPNKGKYPLDYQIYMEEIGEIHLGTGTDGREGRLVVEIHKPLPFVFTDEAEDYNFAYQFPAESPDEIRILTTIDRVDIETKAKDYMVVASDCHSGTYGYYIGKEPYQLASSQDFQGGSDFLELLKNILNDDLDHSLLFLKMKLGLHMKIGGGEFF